MAETCERVAPTRAKTSEGKAAEVERLIAPSIAAMGYDIVRVLISGDQRTRLQVMAERADGSGMTVDDCAAISRTVEALLDVEDPIAGAYELEVSSPGIDRPLTRLADFDRFTGFEAKIETALPMEGQRRWRGQILGLEGDTIRMRTEAGEVRFPFAEIAKAKLLLTDELLVAAQGAQAASKEGNE